MISIDSDYLKKKYDNDNSALFKLKVLNFAKINVGRIEPFTFVSLSSLTELWLNDNQIEQIDASVFSISAQIANTQFEHK